jgi:hypothetical protein
MDNFLDRYQVSELNQDQINYLNCPITPKKLEAIISRPPPPQKKKKKAQDQMALEQSSIKLSKKT